MQTLDSYARDAARAVCVIGNDVYYGGCDADNHPVIWKNGTAQVLSDQEGCVTDLKTANNKLYACGSVNYKPVYWVDGQMEALPTVPGYESVLYESHAIFIAGNDIYVEGTFYLGMTDGNGACLWKNGVLQRLSDKASDARDVCVIGNTVYVVGSEVFSNGGYQKSVMWVDGVIQDVSVTPNSTIDSKATAIVAKNGKPYVVAQGWIGGMDGNYQGFEWQDGVATGLPDCSRPKNVFIHGNDIYIVGICDNYSHTLILLKNRKKVKLSTPSPGFGGCYAVYVK